MISADEKDIMDEIRKDMKSRNRSVRALACKSLAGFKNRGSAFLLISMLSDVDPDVRFHASESLAKIGEAAVTSLIGALAHDEWIVRKQSADILKKLFPSLPSCAKKLRDAVDSDDQNVRYWAIKSLFELGDAGMIEKVENIFKTGNADDRVSIAGIVAGTGLSDRMIDLFIGGLSDGAWRVRKACADALLKEGEKIVDRIIAGLGSHSMDSYYWCARILGDLKCEKAVDPLLSILESGDEDRSEFAIIALGAIGSKRAADSLIGLLGSDSWTIRKCCADALVNIGEPVVPYLAREYSRQESPDDARYWCVRAAGNFKTRESRELIYKALFDPKWFVRSTACNATSEFYEIPSEHAERLFALIADRNSEVGRAAERALDSIGEDTLVGLCDSFMTSRNVDPELNAIISRFWSDRGKSDLPWLKKGEERKSAGGAARNVKKTVYKKSDRERQEFLD